MQGFNIRDIEDLAALIYGADVDDMYLEPYGYPLLIEDLEPGEQRSLIINLSANADFLCTGVRHFAVSDDTSDVTILTKDSPNVRVLMTDASSGDPFTQAAANLDNWSTNGTGEINFDFPRLLQGRGAVNVQVTNVDAAATYPLLEILLSGVLLRSWDSRPRSAQV